MDADRHTHGGPERLHALDRLGFGRVVCRQYAHGCRYPGRLRARNDIFQVAGELLAGDMAVAIDHRTRVPGGTS